MRWPWTRKQQPQLPAPAEVEKLSTQGGFDGGPVPPATKPAGSDGVTTYGGYLFRGERDPRLQGQQKWVTYDNMTLNVAIIASAITIWTQLGGSAKWTAVPNKRGGADAERAADLVTEGLLEAEMSKPWCNVVRRQLMKKFRGFALHEMLIRRRPDGKIVCGDLQDRPQWTIDRWNKPDEKSEWIGVEQLTRTGDRLYIPRDRLFWSVEDTLSSTPDGVGLLRMLAEPARVLELYQQLEGIGFQTDLRGMPSARAPLGKLAQDARSAGAKTADEITAYVKAQTKFLVDFLNGHNKKPEQGLLLDSAPYITQDEHRTPSAIYEWAFEIVRGATSGMPEVGGAIGRITRDVARVMCAEWLLLGGEDSGGAYSMHADKTAMFALVVNGAVRDVAGDGKRDCAARLVRLNGLDPETCTPDLVPEPIATAAVESACRSLLALYQAGMDTRDPAYNVLRGRMDLPPGVEVDEASLMLPRPRPAGPPNITTTPGQGAPAATADPGRAGNVNAQPGAATGKGQR